MTGSAQVINGENVISIQPTTVTIPGGLGTPTSTTIEIKVIELPRTYIGPVVGTVVDGVPVSASVSTSQVEVTVLQNINLLNIPVANALLSPLASVTGTLPIKITAGSATGTLVQVTCAPAAGEVVSVDTSGATTSFGDANPSNKFLSVNVNLLGLGGGLRAVGLNLNAEASVAGVNDNLLSFDYPAEYLPTRTIPKSVGGTTLNVQGTALSSTSVDLLGLLNIGLDTSAVTTALTGPGGLVTALDTALISPVLRALGITVGGADVWAIKEPSCPGSSPVIAG